jgi:pimeloyl-ACP methyl ester carboxylesterase
MNLYPALPQLSWRRAFGNSIFGVLIQERDLEWQYGVIPGLLLATRKPDLFASLILEAPVFPGRPLPAVAEMLARTAETARKKGIAAARQLWWNESGWFAVMRARPEECRATEQRAIIEDFQGRPWLDPGLVSPIAPIDEALTRCRIPTLIMNGEHDMRDFCCAADELAALIPDCRRKTISEAGGFPLWEFPARVNAVVRSFLDTL